MKVILDTNVLVSEIFFGGVPGRIIDAWSGVSRDFLISPPSGDEKV